MKELDDAYYSALSGSAPLAAAAPGGVWRALAPLETAAPFVVFRQSAPDEEKYTFARLAYRWCQYDVAVVDRSESAGAAQAALALAHSILQDATLSLVGWTLSSIRASRTADDHFVDAGGRVWQTVTRTYRMMVVPA